MILLIVIEIFLVIFLYYAAVAFWGCVKSPKFLGHILSDYGELKKFFNFLGQDKIKLESQNVQPVLDSYANNIGSWMKASFSSLDKARNISGVIIALILVATCFLGLFFVLFNLIFFLLIFFWPIPAPAQNNMWSDVQTIILTVYKWNEVDPEHCKEFCTTDQPRMLKNIYQLVSDISPTVT
ncbi:MAG: hypothetical protein ABSE41_03360 [Bacteroidota bacterium]|jgi:hypothetical protein